MVKIKQKKNNTKARNRMKKTFLEGRFDEIHFR